VTPQEQELLKSLTQKINQTQLQEKDPDAENLLGHELGANPDALYILAQTVLVQNIALDQAKAQVAQLQQQLQQAQQAHPQPAHATSFLGRLLGDRDPQPAPPPPSQQQPPAYQPVPQYSQPQYTPPPPQYAPTQPQYAQPQYVPVAGGQPSFLRGAMQTAAGVAAGALAFEGVESILRGFGHGGGYGPGLMGGGMGLGGSDRPVEETVINNYNDEPSTRGFEQDRPESERHFSETADQGSAQFNDASYNTSGDDQVADDDMGGNDTSAFDGSSDDSSMGFDDGGGFGGDSGQDLV
jgi:hypothetical protein